MGHASIGPTGALRVVATCLLGLAAVVTVGLLVLMPATWLLVAIGFQLYPPLERGPFYLWGALGAVPVYGSALASARLRRWFKGLELSGEHFSDAPGIVARLLLALVFVLSPLILANALVLVNGALDDSAPTPHETTVLDKTRSGGGRAPISYTLRVEAWRPGVAWQDLGVSKKVFEGARVLGPLHLTSRSGRLGREWVSSYSVGPATPIDARAR